MASLFALLGACGGAVHAQSVPHLDLDGPARVTALGPRLAALIDSALQATGSAGSSAADPLPALRLVVTPADPRAAPGPAVAAQSLALVGREPYVLAVKTDVAVRHLSEVRDGASDCGSDPSVATPSPGALEVALRLGRGLHLEPRVVDFGGAAAALAGLAAGEIRFVLGSGSDMRPWLDRGEIRLLATTLPRRGGLWPQVPGVEETLPGFEAHMRWDLVPAQALSAAQAAQVASWRERLAQLLAQAPLQQALVDSGLIP